MTDAMDCRMLTLEYLVDQAGIAYIETDRNLRILSWNRGAKTLFGCSGDEVAGQDLTRVLKLESPARSRLLAEEGLCMTTLSSGDRRIRCRIHFTPVVDSEGAKTGIALLIREASETISHPAHSCGGSYATADILGFAPIGIFHVSLTGRLLMANSELAWLLGYESSDQAVQQICDFARQVFYDGSKAEEFMFSLLEAERITRFRCRFKRRDDTFVWILCYAMITRDANGRMNGFYGYAIDIGETIRAETALQKANEQLTRLSVLDGLTQIANRRQFDTRLAEELSRHAKAKHPVSVILCDIDFFKKYNDSYGHQLGDECLKQVAAAIDGCARKSRGLAARYGGEEFGIILPLTSRRKAAAVAESVREAVQALGIEHKASAVDACVTLSLGVGTIIPGNKKARADLLARADKALYAAKTGGRNRVATAEA